jgi:group I intron endonuclease
VKANVIYKIINTVNGKFYVGSTTNTKERYKTHRQRLRRNRHHATHLQAAWNKYGEQAFIFHVVEEVPEGESLRAAEDRWLAEHVGKPHCYNKSRYSDAPMRGIPKEQHPSFGRPKTSAERASISKTLKEFYAQDITNHPRFGKTHSEETRAQISASKLANPTRAWQGKTRSEETKAKISAVLKGRPNPRKGKKMSEQGRANIAAAAKRGPEAHAYGKRPTNAEDLMKVVVAMWPDGRVQEYPSLSAMRAETGIQLPTIIRACRSGLPLKKGPHAGLTIAYKGQEQAVKEVPEEYKALPRSRSQAQAEGAALYFTGDPCKHGHVAPRSTKGACTVCRKSGLANPTQV